MLRNLLQNWKTTSAGLTMIIVATVHLVFAAKAGHADEGTWTGGLTAILGGFGLIFAGDASAQAKTSGQTPDQGPKSGS